MDRSPAKGRVAVQRVWDLGAFLTMTISPGIGVGSRSRNLTFSSLTGTSSARLSAETVSSAGLLWGSACSTATSVCGQGWEQKAG